jgi:hypothetical protein
MEVEPINMGADNLLTKTFASLWSEDNGLRPIGFLATTVLKKQGEEIKFAIWSTSSEVEDLRERLEQAITTEPMSVGTPLMESNKGMRPCLMGD